MEFNSVVKFENEEGKVFEMIILKEFDYKDKKYAVLLDNNCTCDDDCDCKDEKCECDESCECGCQEGKECTCDDECTCGCDEEKALYILEITTDKDGNEEFKEIEDEKIFDEVIKEADKVLYED